MANFGCCTGKKKFGEGDSFPETLFFGGEPPTPTLLEILDPVGGDSVGKLLGKGGPTSTGTGTFGNPDISSDRCFVYDRTTLIVAFKGAGTKKDPKLEIHTFLGWAYRNDKKCSAKADLCEDAHITPGPEMQVGDLSVKIDIRHKDCTKGKDAKVERTTIKRCIECSDLTHTTHDVASIFEAGGEELMTIFKSFLTNMCAGCGDDAYIYINAELVCLTDITPCMKPPPSVNVDLCTNKDLELTLYGMSGTPAVKDAIQGRHPGMKRDNIKFNDATAALAGGGFRVDAPELCKGLGGIDPKDPKDATRIAKCFDDILGKNWFSGVLSFVGGLLGGEIRDKDDILKKMLESFLKCMAGK